MTEGDHQPKGRNIVLCFDGTGDWIGSGKTNVAKIYAALESSETEQVCFYDGGIGTLSDPQALSGVSRTFLRLLDLGVATRLRDKVLRGYQFLVENYRGPEDRIYLFGFSRGAYTARVLAGVIRNFGVLRTENDHIADYVWQTIANVGDIVEFKVTSARIRSMFSHDDVEIAFMGLFDTVSSVGVIGRFNTYPNTDRNDRVQRVCHAVSIDEQRNVFPESLMHPKQKGLTEVWFPGVHRDVGGGLRPFKSRIADEALFWIATEAAKARILFKQPEEKKKADYLFHGIPFPKRDLRAILNLPGFDPYVVVGLYPMKMFNKRVSDFRLLWPNFRHLRVVPKGAVVHPVIQEVRSTQGPYNPSNLPRGEEGWELRALEADGQTPPPERYVVPTVKPNLPDFAGILIGFTLLLALWNEATSVLHRWQGAKQEPLFGATWPANNLPVCLQPWALVAMTFLLFIALQAKGEKPFMADRQRRVLTGVAPAIGLAAMALLLGMTLGTPVLWSGAIGGFGIFAVSQMGRKPVVRADEVVARLLFALISALLVLGTVTTLFPDFLRNAWVGGSLVTAGVLVALRDVLVDRQIMSEAEGPALETDADSDNEAKDKDAGVRSRDKGGREQLVPRLMVASLVSLVLALLILQITPTHEIRYIVVAIGVIAIAAKILMAKKRTDQLIEFFRKEREESVTLGLAPSDAMEKFMLSEIDAANERRLEEDLAGMKTTDPGAKERLESHQTKVEAQLKGLMAEREAASKALDALKQSGRTDDEELAATEGALLEAKLRERLVDKELGRVKFRLKRIAKIEEDNAPRPLP